MLRLEVGAILTLLAVGSMMYWAFHEIRRVDKTIAEMQRRKEAESRVEPE